MHMLFYQVPYWHYILGILWIIIISELEDKFSEYFIKTLKQCGGSQMRVTHVSLLARCNAFPVKIIGDCDTVVYKSKDKKAQKCRKKSKDKTDLDGTDSDLDGFIVSDSDEITIGEEKDIVDI